MLLCAQDFQHPTLDVVAVKESVVVTSLTFVQMNHQLGMRSRKRRSDAVQARECTVVALAQHALRERLQPNDPPLESSCAPPVAQQANSPPTDDL